jgi:predicted nucleic acid-binding protein
MPDRSFLDTNVLVYTDDGDADEKKAAALDLFARLRRERTGVVSTQVLQEYFVASTRKLGVASDTARRKVQLFSRLEVVVIDTKQIVGAIDLARLHKLSFWDALIIRSALDVNCRVLYSEDLQPDRRIDGLRIVNPFT